MMNVDSLLPVGGKLRVVNLAIGENLIEAVVASTEPASRCPDCQELATRVHSRYTRRVADLPWAGCGIHLLVKIRRFVCSSTHCCRRTFSERLHGIVAPFARRTRRLESTLGQLALLAGGEAGARVAKCLGMMTSPDTLLRLVRGLPLPDATDLKVLGVDDWAWRKGRTYGTLLVNLETRRPVDLLPDRAADSLASWLQSHPGITVIARDRAGAYADGARRGAPDAIQVADRWHLLKNMSDALQRLVDRRWGLIRAYLATAPDRAPVPQPASTPSTQAEQAKTVRRQRRLARFEEVRTLHGQGIGIGMCQRV